MIATLSMYDWPETADALDRLWGEIYTNLHAAGLNAPDALARGEHPSTLWTNPELIVGQTCGWPYANQLRGKVTPFARLHYDIPDCPPGHYNSVYIGRSAKDADYLENREALLNVGAIAMNSDDSQSGFHVFREITAEASSKAIPQSLRVVTGAHRNSVKAVASGKAKIAAIDAIAFELAQRHDPDVVADVRIIGHSKPLPGLPLITATKNAPHTEAMFNAISEAVNSLNDKDRDTLLIKGVVPANDTEYEVFL